MRKPLTNEKGIKGKIVGCTLLMLSSLGKKGKGQHEARLAIAGIEDPQPLVALMDVDSPVAAPIIPPLNIAAATAVVTQEKIAMKQSEAEVSEYFAD